MPPYTPLLTFHLINAMKFPPLLCPNVRLVHKNGLGFKYFTCVAIKFEKFQLFSVLKNHICGYSWQSRFLLPRPPIYDFTISLFGICSVLTVPVSRYCKKKVVYSEMIVCYCLRLCYLVKRQPLEKQELKNKSLKLREFCTCLF